MVVQTFVTGNVAVALLSRQIPLRFHSRLYVADAQLAGARQHSLEEIARAGVPGLLRGGDQVGQHQGAPGRVGQDGKGVPVRYQPHFAHRPHSRHRQQLVHIGHRLHRRSQPDAGTQARGQPRRVRGLAPDDAPVVAVQKRHQLHAGSARPPDNFAVFHKLKPPVR